MFQEDEQFEDCPKGRIFSRIGAHAFYSWGNQTLQKLPKIHQRFTQNVHPAPAPALPLSQNIIIFYAITFGGNISINVNNQ